jgi:glycerol uptake facilitator protein
VTHRLSHALVGEVCGTFLLVLFGTGVVAAAVLTGAQIGLWQVAAVWGFGVTIAICVSANVSGAHLNPAVTLAMAAFRGGVFPWSRALPYIGAQLLGGILAGCVVLAVFAPFLDRFERDHGLIRGEAGSERSAMVFGEYFPNPAIYPDAADAALVTPLRAVGVEAFGTAVLVFVIFALTDARRAPVSSALTPLLVGFTVAVLISLFAPLTQAAWNPARDLGPRLVAFAAGWGEIAIPGPRNGFWVYIVGPLLGGLGGGALYQVTLGRAGAGGESSSVPLAPRAGSVVALSIDEGE